jgi:tetratricopeptide (TPR) repeat protein
MSSREKIITAARKFAEQGRFDLAIREFERLVAAYPEDLRSQIKLGFLYARNGDSPGAVDLWLEAAHGFEQKGATQEAATVIGRVLQLEPDHVDAHLWLAQLYAGLDHLAESRRELEVAHQLLEQEGRGGEALRVLEDMVALDPGNVAICIRLGEAYAARDQKEEAIEVMTRAVDVLRQAEWVDDFIRVAERLVWLQPGNVEINKELASHYLRQRDPQSALQKLKRCYEADQTDVGTLKLLADTFIDLREPEKGATILRVLAEVFEQRGERSHAEAVLDHAYRLDPEFHSEETTATIAAVGRKGEHPAESQGVESDPYVLETEEGDWSWQPPAAVDAGDLSPLEMSLQPEGPEEDAPRRFLPAITAEGRYGRLATSPQHHTVTTQELDFGDLIFLEKHRSATTEVTVINPDDLAPPAIVVATTELNLSDLEEVRGASPVVTEKIDVNAMQLDGAIGEVVEDAVDLGEATEKLASMADPPDLSTHELALNELEDLAGELSDRYLGPRSGGAGFSREANTVKYRHNPPRQNTAPRTLPDTEVGDTRRSQRPQAPSSDPVDPRGRRGGRSR